MYTDVQTPVHVAALIRIIRPLFPGIRSSNRELAAHNGESFPDLPIIWSTVTGATVPASRFLEFASCVFVGDKGEGGGQSECRRDRAAVLRFQNSEKMARLRKAYPVASGRLGGGKGAARLRKGGSSLERE